MSDWAAGPAAATSRRGRATVAVSASLVAVLAGCASAPLPPSVVARSSLGRVTTADLARFVADDPRWHGLAPERRDAAWRRDRLEELLALTALADEAKRDRLLASGPAAEAWQLRRRAILVEEVERRLPPAPAVGEPMVDAYLAEHPDELRQGERLRLRHVFRRLPVRATAEGRARARTEMEAVLDELRRGADFGRLARERSDSQTAGFDGLIAPVAPGDLEPAVETVVWRLAVGELSDIVETPAGLHVFRLEERIPGGDVATDQARARVRRRLEQASHQASADRAFADLLASTHARYSPQSLAVPGAAEATVVFELDGERITAGDLRRRWSGLPFADRRTTSLAELLRDEAWQRLAAWQAGRLLLDAEPAVAQRLARAEEDALVAAASARHVEDLKAGVGEAELTEFVAAHADEFRRPAAVRLRALIGRFGPSEAPLAVYDRLDGLAVAVRSGEVDLGEVARLWSTDPSGETGGDLGWVEMQTLALWAGARFAQAVTGLTEGATSDPLLVEVYEPEHLRYRADAYAVVRVEQRRPEGLPPLQEIRTEVLDRLLASRAGAVRRELRRQLLARIAAVIDDAALAAAATPAR